MISLRAGMKVECIKNCEPSCAFDYWRGTRMPQIGERFTISSFQNCRNGDPGIHLCEITPVECPCMGGANPWPVVNFRPIIEDNAKTKAKATVDEIIRKAKEAAPDAPAPVKPKKLEPV